MTELKPKKLKMNNKTEEYENTIKKVIVTYHDKWGWWIFKWNTKRTFDARMWSIFEDKIRKVAKKVKVIKKK